MIKKDLRMISSDRGRTSKDRRTTRRGEKGGRVYIYTSLTKNLEQQALTTTEHKPEAAITQQMKDL